MAPARPPRGLFAGLCTLDVVHRVDSSPGPDEKVTASRQDVCAGGPATNAALTFAALGGGAVLLTGIGRHRLGDVVRSDLAEHGVSVVDLRDSDAARAVSAVRVRSGTGDRSVSSPDASSGTPLRAPGDLSALLDGAGVVLLDGHHGDVARAARRAADHGKVPVVLDAGRWRRVFADMIPNAFVVSSAAFTIDGRVPSAGALIQAGACAAAVTAGSGPLSWALPGAGASIDVAQVDGGDTLGAGDAFHGAVAFAVAAAGRTTAVQQWPQVLRFAADVAALRVATIGPREWLADTRLREWSARWTA